MNNSKEKNEYITTNNFNKINKKIDEHNLTFIHLNIRSLNHNFEYLTDFLNLLTKKPEIICLSETWLNNINNNNLNIPNYKQVINNRHCQDKRRGGGVCIYVTNNLTYNIVNELTFNIIDYLEIVTIEIIQESDNKNITVSCIYNSPFNKIEEFNTIFYDKFHKFINKKLIIMGDFNIDTTNNINSKINQLMHQLGLTPLIHSNTRPIYNTNTNLIIDQIYTNIDTNFIGKSGIIQEQITDHLPIYANFNLNNRLLKNKTLITTRKIKNNNIVTFIKNLLQIKWDTVYNNNNAEDAYNIFYTQYINIINKHFPIITSKVSSQIFSKNWITNNIKRKINKKQKLFNLYLQSKSELDLYVYKSYRNNLQNTIKQAKQKYINKQINDNITSKEHWKTVNNIINTNVNKHNITYIKDKNNKNTFDSSKIANIFNEQFINNAQIINDQFKNQNIINPVEIPNINNSIFIEPTNKQEITSIIKNSKLKTSLDINLINMKIVKISIDYISSPLTHIFNLCISEGIFPQKMKNSIIKPIYKNKNQYEPCNYRPISILCQISKIFEKIIHQRFTSFFQKNLIISNTQYGYTKKHNTTHAILDLYNHILINKEQNKSINTLFLDLSKAFDTLDHNILIDKLYKYGIRSNSLQLIKSYLSNRKQVVLINDKKSQILCNNIGVPQGSILGPLLFIIYTNDLSLLFNNNQQVKLIVYADDTAITFTSENNEKLKYTIDNMITKIEKWYTFNKLKININKTKIVNFNSRKYSNIHLKINNISIQNEIEYKYLGIIIDKDINFKNHIFNLNNKLSKILYSISRLSKYIKTKPMIIIYNSLFLPHIMYGNIIWGNIYKSNLTNLILTQKKIIRIINKTKYFREHTNLLFERNNILKLNSLIKYNTLIYMHDHHNNNLPQNIYNIHKKHENKNKNKLRKSPIYKIPYTKKSQLINSILTMGPKLWNNLNGDIQIIKNKNSYKKK